MNATPVIARLGSWFVSVIDICAASPTSTFAGVNAFWTSGAAIVGALVIATCAVAVAHCVYVSQASYVKLSVWH